MGYNTNLTSILGDFNSDGCGLKNDEKYYFNGTYIDLCGLPIEEYMKGCCCGGINSDTDNEQPSKTINEIIVKSFKTENDEIYYQAFSKFAVTSNIKINAYSTNNILTVLTFSIGDTQTTPEIGNSEEFLTITMSLEEDETYIYALTTEASKSSNYVYINTMLLSEADSYSDEFTKITVEKGATVDLTFVIPSTNVDCNDMETEELKTFCEINQHCLLICLPKTIYDKGEYTIRNLGGDIITNKFAYEKTITIDNIEYVFLKDKATNDIMPYVPIFQEDLVYQYKLTIDK